MDSASPLVAHPLADTVPPMTEDEYVNLRDDIRAHGQIEPIVLFEGQILDGRHRYRACRELGIEARLTSFDGSRSDALARIVSLNLARRHLTVSQRACYAAEIEPLFAAEARKRQQAAAEATNQKLGRKTNEETLRPISGEASLRADQQAAQVCKVGKQAVSTAKRVRAKAPTLFEQVKAGALPLEEANRQVNQTEREAKIAEQRARSVPTTQPDNVTIREADSAHVPLLKESIDLIVTSPPYGLGKDYGLGEDDPDVWIYAIEAWTCEMFRVAKPGGRLAINVPLDTAKGGYRPTYAQAVLAAHTAGWTYRSTIVWNERNVTHSVGRGSQDSPSAPYVMTPVEMIALFSKGEWKRDATGRESDLTHDEWLEWTNGLWTFGGESRPWDGHPAPFPEELPRRLIRLLSFVGDTVLDPFVGSGTTAVAALKLGREFVGFDINPEYVASAMRRVAEVAGGLPRA